MNDQQKYDEDNRLDAAQRQADIAARKLWTPKPETLTVEIKAEEQL